MLRHKTERPQHSSARNPPHQSPNKADSDQVTKEGRWPPMPLQRLICPNHSIIPYKLAAKDRLLPKAYNLPIRPQKGRRMIELDFASNTPIRPPKGRGIMQVKVACNTPLRPFWGQEVMQVKVACNTPIRPPKGRGITQLKISCNTPIRPRKSDRKGGLQAISTLIRLRPTCLGFIFVPPSLDSRAIVVRTGWPTPGLEVSNSLGLGQIRYLIDCPLTFLTKYNC